MRGGIGFAVAAAAVAVAGCAAKSGQLQVRALPDPVSRLGVGSERVAEARGQLALGNIGLAIEAFHTALREQPDNVDAMNGLAACYDAMGRTDLSRQYYEAALAVAPRNPVLLNAYAASLDAQGNRAQAIELRSEAVQVSAGPIPVALPSATALSAAAASVTIALAPPTPAPAPSSKALIAAATSDGPRLQRLSLGEVALLTSGEPAWQARVISRSAQTTTLRWVAMADSAERPNIRLLNAARAQGLAARTRDYLLQRGWRKIEIGDADGVRESSLIMYPGNREATGRSLAAQFGFRPNAVRQGQVIVVLLGRDAVPARAPQARG